MFVLLKFGSSENISVLFGGGMILYATYSIVILLIPARHFLLGMLDMECKKMRLAGSGYNQGVLEKWRREIWFVGVIFILLGFILILIK